MFTFSEIQKFRQWWIWTIILLPFAVALFIVFGNTEIEDDMIPVFFVVPSIALFFIFLLRLETQIDREKISYRFFPFHFKMQNLYWNEIESAHVREYKPIKEYGGWGIRQSFRKGKAFNVAGNKGLQLVLKNGKKILLGTQKPEEIQQLLLQLKIPVKTV